MLTERGNLWRIIAEPAAQRRNTFTQLATLAGVEGLERFKYYIYCKPVKVVTDCNAVKIAMGKRELIPRIARWWLRI